LSIGVSLCGHFVKPHNDFLGFWESGRALWSGQLPASFKFAPAYPLVVVALGRVLGWTIAPEAPDLLAAQWLNALLLPLNAVLTGLIGRRWLGSQACWPAVWFLLLPVGFYCTAQVLLEPLLVSLLLLTVLAIQRESRWAYVVAALASMTRYDAAGAIAGVALVDIWRNRQWRAVGRRAGLALLPLAAWLVLTAATWSTRGAGHYLQQIAQEPGFDIGWASAVVVRNAFSPDALRWPAALADLVPALPAVFEPALRGTLRELLIALAPAGALALLKRRDGAAVVALLIYAGYTLVHAVFAYQMERFGYPLVPLFLLACGCGLAALWRQERWPAALAGAVLLVRLVAALLWPGASPLSPAVGPVIAAGILLGLVIVWPRLCVSSQGRSLADTLRAVLGALAFALLVTIIVGESAALYRPPGRGASWAISLPVLCTVALAALPVFVMRPAHGRGAGLAVLALMTLALVNIRSAAQQLGSGREMANVIEAARWVRAQARPEENVLCAEPALFSLFTGDERPTRFLGFAQIQAQNPPEVVAELRARGVAFIIWYDEVYQEHGPGYTKPWRLERFAALSDPQTARDVEVVRRYADKPTLLIYRILPATR
jgi:hypothetical protein